MASLLLTREQSFIGYNDKVPPEFIKPGYLADALNCFIRGGRIIKRSGYSAVGSTVGAYKCQGWKGARWADGSKEMLAVFNGSIYKSTGGNFTLVTSGSGVLDTSAQVDIVIANNRAYFFDGTSTVPKYTPGGSISTVAGMPKGKYGRWFHNQLHVAGMSGTPNTLQSSDIGDPETFVAANSSSLAINPNDGDQITGLSELKDQLFIFKQSRVWAASGFGTSAITLANINEQVTGVGTISHRSIVNIGNKLLYISFLGGKVHIRSIMRSSFGVILDGGIVSDDIEVSLAGLNTAQLSLVAGAFDGRTAYFSCPSSGQTVNDTVYTLDIFTNGWTRHTGINATLFDVFTISSTPQIYFGSSTATGLGYVFDTSTSDNGSAINFQVISRRYGGDMPEIKKKWKWIYIYAKESGNYNVTIDYALDGFSYANLATLNLSGSGSIFDSIVLDTSRLGTTDVKKKRYTFMKTRNYYLQFKAYDTSSTSSVEIRNWEIFFFKKNPTEE